MSDIILTTTVWKRRSGFAQFSDAITGSNSWEKRRLTLHRGTNKTATRLCYYAIDGKSPRGTVYIKSERATIWANHHPSDGSQPTPYSISVLPDGGTKWKFCFDNRNVQFAWLLVLNDVVVEDCIKQYNSKILLKEASNWDHGGFHRLYEEGTPGLFESVKDMLLGNKADIAGLVSEKSEPSRQNSAESIEVLGIKKGHESAKLVNEAVDEGLNSVNEASANNMTKSDVVVKSGIPAEKLYQALLVVNLSVIYVYATAKSESSIAVPWWQLLIAMNAIIYYVCFNPKHESSHVQKTETSVKCVADLEEESSRSLQTNGTRSFEDVDEGEPSSSLTKSTVGRALLAAEEVPLSEVPMELHQKPQIELNDSHQRTEHLTEDEMAAHLHERWAMSAPDCDLSGSWTLIADDSFKTEYDTYLKQLGFNRITRGVACSLIARTTEITKQSKNGRELYLKGTNPKGAWERVLVSSGYPDFETHSSRKEGTDYAHMKTSIKTADSEDVDAEAWWEERGTIHRSWLRGGTKYGGGDFESLRYLEEGSKGNVLVSVLPTSLCALFSTM